MIEIAKIFKQDGSIDNVALRTELERLNKILLISERLQDLYWFEFDLALGVNTLQHNLNFVPKSVIMLYVLPSTTVITTDYEEFTTKDFQLTTTAACEINCLVGSYREDL